MISFVSYQHPMFCFLWFFQPQSSVRMCFARLAFKKQRHIFTCLAWKIVIHTKSRFSLNIKMFFKLYTDFDNNKYTPDFFLLICAMQPALFAEFRYHQRAVSVQECRWTQVSNFFCMFCSPTIHYKQSKMCYRPNNQWVKTKQYNSINIILGAWQTDKRFLRKTCLDEKKPIFGFVKQHYLFVKKND